LDVTSTKWIERHFKIAYEVASWSKDPSTQVGAIIVTPEGKPRSWGFNGIPMGIPDTPDKFIRPIKYKYFSHAERNALDLCETSVDGCVLFCTHSPCSDCARGIITKGIKVVIVDAKNGFYNNTFTSRHNDSFQCHLASLDIFSNISYLEFCRISKTLYSVTLDSELDNEAYKIQQYDNNNKENICL
jgi:dCMP deaminase